MLESCLTGLFVIDNSTGAISTGLQLLGYAGVYHLNVSAQNTKTGSPLSYASVIITVLSSEKAPIVWTAPATDGYLTSVQEVSTTVFSLSASCIIHFAY
jgi:hypothetical protein